jgi:hypothetical protein
MLNIACNKDPIFLLFFNLIKKHFILIFDNLRNRQILQNLKYNSMYILKLIANYIDILDILFIQ